MPAKKKSEGERETAIAATKWPTGVIRYALSLCLFAMPGPIHASKCHSVICSRSDGKKAKGKAMHTHIQMKRMQQDANAVGISF